MILFSIDLWPAFAQISNWERLGDSFRTHGSRRELSDLIPFVVVGIVAAGVAYGVVWWRRRNDMTRRCNNPEKLFRELCLAHQIDTEGKRILRQLADARQFTQPAQVFVRPDAFEGADLPPTLAEQIPQLGALKQRLFGR